MHRLTNCWIDRTTWTILNQLLLAEEAYQMTYEAARYTAKYEREGLVEQMSMMYPTSP